MGSVWSVSKLSIESVGSRRELDANSVVHTADADATQLGSRVASAVYIKSYWAWYGVNRKNFPTFPALIFLRRSASVGKLFSNKLAAFIRIFLQSRLAGFLAYFFLK